MITYPYQILKQKLAADVTELREIELNTGQDSTTDKDGLLLASQGAYITFFPNAPHTLSGTKIQSAATQFEILLLTECMLEGGKRLKKDQPLDHMRIFDKIFKSLQGFSSKLSYLPEFALLAGTENDQKVMASVNRISIPAMPQLYRRSFMRSVQRFSALMFDHGGATLYETIPKPPMELAVIVEQRVFGTFDDTFDETFD